MLQSIFADSWSKHGLLGKDDPIFRRDKLSHCWNTTVQQHFPHFPHFFPIAETPLFNNISFFPHSETPLVSNILPFFPAIETPFLQQYFPLLKHHSSTNISLFFPCCWNTNFSTFPINKLFRSHTTFFPSTKQILDTIYLTNQKSPPGYYTTIMERHYILFEVRIKGKDEACKLYM